MIGKIMSDGTLHISRAGRFRRQLCCYQHDPYGGECMDFCPLFGEPTKTDSGIILRLCHGKELMFSQLTDERSNVIEQTKED